MTSQKMVLAPDIIVMPLKQTVNFVSPVLGIRIRMFLGLPDPEVRGTDPDPSIITKDKMVRKTFVPTIL